MDGGDSAVLLKGDSGLLTASGLFKPAYYAHLILSKFQGELIAYDPHYVAIRTAGDRPCYLIAVLITTTVLPDLHRCCCFGGSAGSN